MKSIFAKLNLWIVQILLVFSIVFPSPAHANGFTEFCGQALSWMGEKAQSAGEVAKTAMETTNFGSDHWNDPLLYGSVTAVSTAGVYLAYRLGRGNKKALTQRYQHLDAATRLPQMKAYEAEVKDFEETLREHEKAILAMPEEQFKEWAKGQAPAFAKQLKKLRKAGTPPALPDNALDHSRQDGNGIPFVKDQYLEGLQNKLRTHVTNRDAKAEKLAQALKQMGLAHVPAEALQSLAIDPSSGSLKLENLEQLLSRAERYSQSLHSERDQAAALINGPLAIDDMPESAGRRLRRATVPHDLGPWTKPGLLNRAWLPLKNLSRITGRTMKSARLLVVLFGTPFGVYFMQQQLNMQAQGERAEQEQNELIDQDQEAALRNQLPVVTSAGDDLLFMMVQQWQGLRDEYGDEMNAPFPFDFLNPEHRRLARQAYADAEKDIRAQAAEHPDRYTEKGRLDVDIYRAFWAKALKAAQELPGGFTRDAALEERFFGEDGSGTQGLIDTLARQSAERGREKAAADLQEAGELLTPTE